MPACIPIAIGSPLDIPDGIMNFKLYGIHKDFYYPEQDRDDAHC